MLFIEMEKVEFPGGHSEIMLFIEIAKLDLTGGHIRIILFSEIDKGEPNSNISISINSIKTIWPRENRIFNSFPFWACCLRYI